MTKRPLVASARGAKAARVKAKSVKGKTARKAVAKKARANSALYNPKKDAKIKDYLKRGMSRKMREQIDNEDSWIKPSRETLLQTKMTF